MPYRFLGLMMNPLLPFNRVICGLIPLVSIGFFFLFLLFVIQFCFPFGLPLFKLFLGLFVLKKLLNGGHKALAIESSS